MSPAWLRIPRRFSLRALLVLTALAAVPLAWIVNRAHAQRAAVAAVLQAGGTVHYDYQKLSNSKRIKIARGQMAAPEPGPRWLRSMLGEDYLADVVEIYVSEPGEAKQAGASRPLSLAGLRALTSATIQLESGAVLESLPASLTILDLHGPLRPEGIAALKRLRLARLTLFLPDFSPDHARALGRLRTLESLKIYCEGMTDDHLALLLDAPEAGFRELHVSSRQLTDRTLARLENALRLESVMLHGGDLSDPAIERLLARRSESHLAIYPSEGPDGVQRPGPRRLHGQANPPGR